MAEQVVRTGKHIKGDEWQGEWLDKEDGERGVSRQTECPLSQLA